MGSLFREPVSATKSSLKLRSVAPRPRGQESLLEEAKKRRLTSNRINLVSDVIFILACLVLVLG